MTKQNLLGEVLDGRYKLIDLIGEGKTGFVYKAEQLKFNRVVAVKILHSHLLNSEEATKRFHREARANSQIKHKNLLEIIDFGVTENQLPYMVTDYIDGISLEDIVASGQSLLSTEQIVTIFQKLCEGLHAAHDKHIIHRDIRPTNIMLVKTREGNIEPKVIDFGLVKFLDDQETQLTQAGQIKGTPQFISPEQCTGQQQDARSDLYSLACVLYLALTGKAPFDSDDIADLLFKHVKEMPSAFSEIAPERQIPSNLEKVVFKALSKKPEDRFQNMNEFKNTLASLNLEEKETPNIITEGVNTDVMESQKVESDQALRDKKQHVMHDVEKGDNRLLVRDQYWSVDEKESSGFAERRKRQTEELSERILRSVQSSFVGDQTMNWLQGNLDENVSMDADPQDKNLCQLSMTNLMDKLFDDFQRYEFQFNQTETNREYVVTCYRPSQKEGSAYSGHLQNSIWALKVIGDSASIRFAFIQTQHLYRQELMSPTVVLELKPALQNNQPCWLVNGKPLYESQLSPLSKKIFARLMRVSRGEVSENDLLELDVSQENAVVDTQTSYEEPKQNPDEVITYSFITILEAIDTRLMELQKEGVAAMQKGGIDAVSPIMMQTKQYSQIREKTSELAKEWASLIVK